jgi:hypothetical protein
VRSQPAFYITASLIFLSCRPNRTASYSPTSATDYIASLQMNGALAPRWSPSLVVLKQLKRVLRSKMWVTSVRGEQWAEEFKDVGEDCGRAAALQVQFIPALSWSVGLAPASSHPLGACKACEALPQQIHSEPGRIQCNSLRNRNNRLLQWCPHNVKELMKQLGNEIITAKTLIMQTF